MEKYEGLTSEEYERVVAIAKARKTTTEEIANEIEIYVNEMQYTFEEVLKELEEIYLWAEVK